MTSEASEELRMVKQSTINGLGSFPIEIIFEILSRLPIKSVLQCKCVCKSWNSVVLNHSFAYMHPHHATKSNNNNPTSHIILSRINNGCKTRIYFAEYENQNLSSWSCKLTEINHPPIKNKCIYHEIVGSCNGLICLIEKGLAKSPEEQLFVCNPITGEYIFLPKFSDEKYLKAYFVYGFGFNPKNQEYKVVCIHYKNRATHGDVKVFTLGTSKWKWRRIGEIPYLLNLKKPGVHADGALHSVTIPSEGMESKNIISFDLAGEKFQCIRSPPGLQLANTHKLLEWRGCLCVFSREFGTGLDVWTLVKKTEIEEEMWSKKFFIKECNHTNSWCYDPWSLTSSGELHTKNNLVAYKSETETSELILNHENLSDFKAIVHVGSLVSP